MEVGNILYLPFYYRNHWEYTDKSVLGTIYPSDVWG